MRFNAIVTQVDIALRKKMNLEDAKKYVDVSSFRSYFVTDNAAERHWDFFVGEAIARAYQEARNNEP